MQTVNFLNIFKAFFKIGAILLGGGYVIVPVMKSELLEKRNWLSEDEICNYYCISQCLPGIIAVNMSILVGYKLLKVKGVFASVFAMALSPFISIIIIAELLNKILNLPYIEGVFFGVNLAVIILIYLTVKEMWNKSIVDKFSSFWFIFILLLFILKVSPVLLIILSILTGFIIQIVKDKQHG